MTDNITAPGTGAVISAELISGVYLVRNKIALGATDVDGGNVGPTNPIPIFDGYQAATTVTWTSVTSLNTAQTSTISGYDTIVVTFVPTGSITGGVVTFEVYDGATWVPIRGFRAESYNSDATYTLTGLTRSWQFSAAGFQQFRARLSTQITSSGSALFTQIVSSAPDVSGVTVGVDPSQPMPGQKNVAVTVAQTVTASSAYTTGNLVGGLMTFANALGTYSLTGQLQSIAINSKSANSAVTYILWLFNANPSSSTWTDKNAPSINAADVAKVIGQIASGAGSSGLGTHTNYDVANVGQELVGTTTTIYGVLTCVGTPTYVSTSDVSVILTIAQDG